MTIEEAINELASIKEYFEDRIENEKDIAFDKDTAKKDAEAMRMAIKALEQTKWIPVKWHTITEEERVTEEYPNEWLVHLDCILPEGGEEILITTKHGYVENDTAYCDGYLDSGYDWIEDVIAWMPLPEPYKSESEVPE